MMMIHHERALLRVFGGAGAAVRGEEGVGEGAGAHARVRYELRVRQSLQHRRVTGTGWRGK